MKPSVFESFDETVLLAYVEDELAPEQASRLCATLAEHDGVLEHLERLREDRRNLRSLAEPQLPRDLLTQLEPMLARPMLVETRPGAYRRRHRRQRRRLLGRLAGAAAVVIVAGAAVILSLVGLPEGAGDAPGGTAVAAADPAEAVGEIPSARGGATPATVAADTWPPDGALVHHHLPGRSRVERWLAEGTRSSTPAAGRDGAAPDAAPVPLPFALIVLADASGVEPQLVSGLAAMDGSITLVRNFSFEEARRIEAQLADSRRRRGSEPRAPLAAGIDRPDRAASIDDPDDALIRRVLEQIDRNARQQATDRPPASRRLLGRAALAATPRHQLIFSGQGASHTVTVPAVRLAELLQRLHDLPSVSTQLFWLPQEVTDPSELSWSEPPELSPDGNRSLSDRARIVAHVDRLLADDPNALVLLPIHLLSAP